MQVIIDVPGRRRPARHQPSAAVEQRRCAESSPHAQVPPTAPKEVLRRRIIEIRAICNAEKHQVWP